MRITMKTTFFLLCAAFLFQATIATKKERKIPTTKSDIHTKLQNEEGFRTLSETAQDTVATILNHIVYMLRDPKASDAIKEIVFGFETVLTSPVGQENVMSFLDLAGFVLKDNNASKIAMKLCDQLNTLMTTPQGREILRRSVLSAHKVFRQDSVVVAVDSFLKNFNSYLREVQPNQLAGGLAVMKRAIAKFTGTS